MIHWFFSDAVWLPDGYDDRDKFGHEDCRNSSLIQILNYKTKFKIRQTLQKRALIEKRLSVTAARVLLANQINQISEQV